MTTDWSTFPPSGWPPATHVPYPLSEPGKTVEQRFHENVSKVVGFVGAQRVAGMLCRWCGKTYGKGWATVDAAPLPSANGKRI